MKRNGTTILALALLIGAAALSAGKLGGPSRGVGGQCSGGTCCLMLPGLNVWSTKSCGQADATNAKPAVMAGETVTNHAQ